MVKSSKGAQDRVLEYLGTPTTDGRREGKTDTAFLSPGKKFFVLLILNCNSPDYLLSALTFSKCNKSHEHLLLSKMNGIPKYVCDRLIMLYIY